MKNIPRRSIIGAGGLIAITTLAGCSGNTQTESEPNTGSNTETEVKQGEVSSQTVTVTEETEFVSQGPWIIRAKTSQGDTAEFFFPGGVLN